MSSDQPYFWYYMAAENIISWSEWIVLLVLLWKILKEFRRFNAK